MKVKIQRICVLMIILVLILNAITIEAWAKDSPLEINNDEESENPIIISAKVEPTKVKPGDVMLVTAEVKDEYGIKSVTADMGGIETIELELKEGDIYQGVWENKWKVHSTEAKDYVATIAATNILNKTATKEIKWSDPEYYYNYTCDEYVDENCYTKSGEDYYQVDDLCRIHSEGGNHWFNAKGSYFVSSGTGGDCEGAAQTTHNGVTSYRLESDYSTHRWCSTSTGSPTAFANDNFCESGVNYRVASLTQCYRKCVTLEVNVISAGTPQAGKSVTVYETGTNTAECQKTTDSAGKILCGLPTTKNYDIAVDGVRYIYNVELIEFSTARTVELDLYVPLNINLRTATGGAQPNVQMVVKDAATKATVCKGLSDGSGVMICGLDVTKKYDIHTGSYGANMYDVAVPNTITLVYYSATVFKDYLIITVEDSVGRPLENTQVSVYRGETVYIACQGNTNVDGRIKCELDTTYSYDAKAIGQEITGIIVPTSITITPATISLLSLSGRVRYTNNSLIPTGSFNISIKDRGGNTIWGPNTFNNSIINGEFGLVLGVFNVLYLVPTMVYTLEIAVCDLENFEATAGNCVPGSSHYDSFTTGFKA